MSTREFLRRRWPILAAIVVAVVVVVSVVVVSSSGGESALAATDQSLGWNPPPTIDYNGHPYPLFTGQGALLVSSKSTVANYISTAWCGPVLAGHPPSRPSVESFFAPGSKGAKRAAHQVPTQLAPDNIGGITSDPIFAPVPGPVTHPMCNWVSNFPRIATTGAYATPQMALQTIPPHRLVYPALYGTVTVVHLPTDVELSYQSASGAVHVYLSGSLTLTQRGGTLAPTNWTTNSYWSRPNSVSSPEFLTTNGHHWNYHGANLGPGMKEPRHAATIS